MSVYNFNDNEHAATNNHESCQTNGNGLQQTGYQQLENEFLTRNLNQAQNHGESSVQLTRPTSKTALLVRQRRSMLEQLSCSICKGYLIDATTINQCVDSFCKPCIALYLTNHNDCPKCGVILHHRNPLDATRPDKMLQGIVYKLVPGLFDDEMRRRREFYKEHYGAVSTSSSEEDDSSSSCSLTVQGSSLVGERYGVVGHPKPFYKPSDSIDLSIEPQTRGENTTIYFDNKRQSIVTCFTGSLQRDHHDDSSTFTSVDSQLFKTYLRCPARLTIHQLKKFITAKFNVCRDDTIQMKYLNESLKDEYSLIDVAYIYDWRGVEHMQLFYIIERDLSKVTIPNGNHIDRRTGKSTRPSVGNSTQTVKRVCIDPKPKFYEEKNNNHIDSINTEGRSMRPRVENSVRLDKTTQITQTNPIIKLTRITPNEYPNSGVKSNGTTLKVEGSTSNKFFSTRQQAPITQARISAGGVGVKEPRSLRSQLPVATRTPISNTTTSSSMARINFIMPPAKAANDISKNNITRNIERNVATIPQNRTMSQIVPYNTGTKFTAVASATQSSMVTMESIVEARSNHVVTTMSSNARASATYTNSQGGPPSATIKTGPAPRFDSTPQLAFSFVTERGITIVRRINNQESSTSTSTSNTISGNGASSRPQMISGPASVQANSAQPTKQSIKFTSAQTSSSRPTPDDSVSSRHQIKVKPVYKTLVDPTKLKSPNLKKLGFTARH